MNKLFIIIIIVISLIFFNIPVVLANTWSPPAQGCVPPNCNTAEPIDVSAQTQNKDGILTVERLGVNTLNPQSLLEIRGGNVEIDGSDVESWLSITNNNDLLVRGINPIFNIEHYTGTPGGSTLQFGHVQYEESLNPHFQPKPLAEISSVLFDGSYDNKAGHLKFKTSYSGTLYDRMIITNAGKIGIGTNDPQQTLEVRDDTSGIATLRITDTGQNPELQWQYNTGTNDHWAIYVDKSDSNKLKVWGVGSLGDNRLTVTTDGKLGVGTTNPSYKLDVQGGQINASGGLCIADECKTSWSQVSGGINYPIMIKETTGLEGIHNADFSSYGANGWLGIKNFASNNGCAAPWHVCQNWELSYIYSQGISTAGCDNTNSGYEGDGAGACLGWTIGPVSESTIETESGFMEAGDCYGYKSAAVDIYHSTVWYIDQWGAATCNSDLPVLCCQ